MTTGILFVENYIAGGSDQVAHLLLKQLPFSSLTLMVNQNDDTTILLAGALPPHVTVVRYHLVTVPELLSICKSKKSAPLRTLFWMMGHLLRYPLFVFSIFYFFIRIVRTKASVFVANNGGYPGGDYCRSASIAASLVPRMKVFHIVHSMAVPPPLAIAAIEWLIDYSIDSRCRLITVCRAAADQLKAKRRIKQDAEVIYNGLEPVTTANDTSDQSYENDFTILNVGYFDRNKNQAMLVRALGDLVEKGFRSVSVHFLGAETEDAQREACSHLASELGVAKHVSFDGFVTDPQPWYQTCDLFVLCSDCEGLPITILEAMRSGKPVVATAVGGVSELVLEGVNGFVIQPGDFKSLAIRIGTLLLDRPMARQFGAAGKASFDASFTMERMVSKYAHVFGLTNEARSLTDCSHQ